MLIILLQKSFAQIQEFQIQFELRFENQKIYCDFVPLEDYQVIGMQFGVNHNSDQVTFDTLYSDVLDNLFRKNFNEICPRKVLMAWNSNSNKNVQLKKGQRFLTIEYSEIQPTDHFICLMPSFGIFCESMPREVIYTNGSSFVEYKVNDACIEYKIKDGVIIVDSENPLSDQFNSYFDQTSNTLQLLSNESPGSTWCQLSIYDLNGLSFYSKKLLGTGIHLNLDDLPSGMYFYVIRKNNVSVSQGRFVKMH